LRNPSHVAIASMGFASTFARLSFGGRGPLNPSYEFCSDVDHILRC
jgi:hypothetical protein